MTAAIPVTDVVEQLIDSAWTTYEAATAVMSTAAAPGMASRLREAIWSAEDAIDDALPAGTELGDDGSPLVGSAVGQKLLDMLVARHLVERSMP
ncbi:MAG: hypothetical protein CME34_18775 [Gordonia sp.]|uniref:hypothetical protein n=1 Tax=Gordonia sp. (in: high G+C Gram-positive bacteria) TaxID=84139 RepID=UPI000C3F364A|nr:hypothetical protein [Gordonia sp. (in: high G+C Gram-positive bacteria)]MAU83871.1 hypothetical protein [Gordonia sp. (in: high G+C Gram-positive bacteria)]